MHACALVLRTQRSSWTARRAPLIATTDNIPALVLAGGAAPCAFFAPPLLLCVSSFAFLSPQHRGAGVDRVARCGGLRGGNPFTSPRASRMELHDSVGVVSKRMRMTDSVQAQEHHKEDDATVEGLTLQLETQEAALFELLMAVVEQKKLPCVLRVAGGWVRDKIMGKQAHDIDIAIDTMMGQEFTQHLVDYMKEAGREKEVGSVGVIKSNPDQSKHLETATLRVMGFELDFVNLRAEEYTDSRIPIMRIGTALEDAMRRDLTINALFYNINRRTVEDFTGKGMADIKAGIVRTPLLANQTMIDDPLRALRTIRFACRLGFQLEQVLEATLATAEVREALCSKVSKERVLSELNGMLLGPDPARALELLYSFSLLPTVFATPPASQISGVEEGSCASLDASWPDKGMALVRQVSALSSQLLLPLHAVPAAEGRLSSSACGGFTTGALGKDGMRLLLLTALLTPLHAFQVVKFWERSSKVVVMRLLLRIAQPFPGCACGSACRPFPALLY